MLTSDTGEDFLTLVEIADSVQSVFVKDNDVDHNLQRLPRVLVLAATIMKLNFLNRSFVPIYL